MTVVAKQEKQKEASPKDEKTSAIEQRGVCAGGQKAHRTFNNTGSPTFQRLGNRTGGAKEF